MECAPHRIWKKLMALVLSLVLMAVMLPGALAVDLNVDAGFYFKQSRGGTCTLASAAMMLRRRAFLDGLTDWTDVTENSVRGSAPKALHVLTMCSLLHPHVRARLSAKKR